MKDRICTSCGYRGQPVTDDPTSFLVDLFVWLLVFAIAGITGIFPLIVIAPALTIWHFIWYKTRKCPKCENLDMVSLNSHAAHNYLATSREHVSGHRHMPTAH